MDKRGKLFMIDMLSVDWSLFVGRSLAFAHLFGPAVAIICIFTRPVERDVSAPHHFGCQGQINNSGAFRTIEAGKWMFWGLASLIVSHSGGRLQSRSFGFNLSDL